MTEDASAARSARGARPLDLKARIRSQRSGEGKGGDLEAGGIFGWMPLFTGGEREAFVCRTGSKPCEGRGNGT